MESDIYFRRINLRAQCVYSLLTLTEQYLWAHGHSSRRVHSHWSTHVRMSCEEETQRVTLTATHWYSCKSTYGTSLKSQELRPATDNTQS